MDLDKEGFMYRKRFFARMFRQFVSIGVHSWFNRGDFPVDFVLPLLPGLTPGWIRATVGS